MKKKIKISIALVIIVVTVGVITFVTGSMYVVKITLPYLRHETMLKTDVDIVCLTLGVAHGCENEYYNEEELEKYLKEDVLTKISLLEMEYIVLKGQRRIIESADKTEYSLRRGNEILLYYNRLIPIIQKMR